MSYSWYNATAIARRTSRATGENNTSILQTVSTALGALIIFGILDNITPLWSVLGLQLSSVYSEPVETQEYIIIGDDQEAADEIPLPLMTPALPRRTTGGRGAKQVQNEDSSMTPTTLRRSNRVKEREAKSAFPTAPNRSYKRKGKSIKTSSLDDFYEPFATPTGQKKAIKGREKQIVLDEYEAFMDEPEEEKTKKAESKDDFDYEAHSTPWAATQRKNVSKGKFGKIVKGKGQKK
ncbi:hypothetical protein BHYA_0061g00110 [Botrytis hyacinthi]|uniref:Uncharacterized protein n=1 Tax=Botrytis hyacinthi TaxID=278943 RepID=A0A4Z1GQ56_9HELO|nr:hypothetical protein BHYA_0061g00110 [Botrytis hyacinthi]